MPKMTHWNSPEPVEVSPEKAAVYAAQGWMTVDKPTAKVQPGVVRESSQETAVESAPAKAPAKKAASKKTAKKAASKSST